MIEAVEAPRPSLRVPISTQSREGNAPHNEWHIAVEVPVQISINETPFTVLLASPIDLDDLARGVLLTEQIIDDASCITALSISGFLQEYTVNVSVPPHNVHTTQLGARSLLGNSGCGLCGIEALAQLRERSANSLGDRLPVTDAAILSAVAALSTRQPLNAHTHSVHAAAWCTLDGTVQLVREDVGRHNALDKVIGALAAAGLLHTPGFLLLTSRCSYELVYKAATANTQLLATIGAPTSMALQWAESLELPLAALWQQRNAPPAVVRFPSPPPAIRNHAG